MGIAAISTSTGTGTTPGAAMLAPLDRFAQALGTDASSLGVDEVRRQMHLVRSVQAVAAARLLELDDRMRTIAATGASLLPVDPQRELQRHGGLRGREVRAVETQSAAAHAAPQLGELLAAGATTAAHLESMGQALRTAGDGRDALLDRTDEIVVRAATMRVDEFDRYVKRLARDAQPDEGLGTFEQQRRRTFLRLWNEPDGMVRLSGAFDPERGAALAGVLDRRVEAMFHSGDRHSAPEAGSGREPDVEPGIDPNDHRRAIALHELCAGGRVGTRADDTGRHDATSPGDGRPTRAEVVVHIDLRTLREGLHDESVCRTSQGNDLPPETVRRLACDGEIIPVVLGPPSAPLDVGRSRRLATVHQRRALEAVHQTCAIPDCDVGFSRCTIHHIRPWERGGSTDLANLVPLCTRHHHAVHEGGWSVTLHPDTRELTVTLPAVRSSNPCPAIAPRVRGCDPPSLGSTADTRRASGRARRPDASAVAVI